MAHLRCDLDLDWATYTCPCGATLCTRGMEWDECRKWINSHRQHTDGNILEHCLPSCLRIYTEYPPDVVKPF